MRLKLIKVFVGIVSLVLIIQISLFMKNTNKTKNEPLVIYIAENDHGDMSYGSLVEQIIKDCHEKGLSTKTFSEFPSQTAKSQKQKSRTPDLMNINNSRESVEATAKFLDGEFIEMGSIQGRYPMWDSTWKQLPEGTTPEQLVMHLRNNVDNPELLEMMERDLVTGEISGADKIGNLENFYAYWRSPMHYKQTHEIMAKDVRDNLSATGNPDVVILVAGNPHIPGLDQQLPEFRDSQKIVVGNYPQGLDALGKILFGGTPKACATVGKPVSFEVDFDKKEAIIPDAVKEAIDKKSQSKKEFYAKPQISLDALDLATPQKPSPSPEKSHVEKMIGKSRDGFNEL